MKLIRPRLTDFHGIYQQQAELDFAIPFLEEDEKKGTGYFLREQDATDSKRT